MRRPRITRSAIVLAFFGSLLLPPGAGGSVKEDKSCVDCHAAPDLSLKLRAGKRFRSSSAKACLPVPPTPHLAAEAVMATSPRKPTRRANAFPAGTSTLHAATKSARTATRGR